MSECGQTHLDQVPERLKSTQENNALTYLGKDRSIESQFEVCYRLLHAE